MMIHNHFITSIISSHRLPSLTKTAIHESIILITYSLNLATQAGTTSKKALDTSESTNLLKSESLITNLETPTSYLAINVQAIKIEAGYSQNIMLCPIIYPSNSSLVTLQLLPINVHVLFYK